MVPIALPSVPNTVGVGRNGGGRHHVLVDFEGVPNVVFGVVHDAVAVLVSHQLKGASQSHGCVKVRQAVADAPVMAFSRCASVAFLGNIVAGIFVVAGFAGISHAFVAGREFKDEFNLVDPTVVSLVPILVLSVGCSPVSTNEAVAKVVVVAVVVGCAQGRSDIQQNARHAANVGCGHGCPGDGHVVEVALGTGGRINGGAAGIRCPNVSSRCTDIRPGVLLVHASTGGERGDGGAVMGKGCHGDGRGGIGVDVGSEVARALST